MTSVFGVLRWRDVVDIVVVATLIYRVLTLFRGTRAVQITIGLGVVGAAAVVARTRRSWGGRRRTSWWTA